MDPPPRALARSIYALPALLLLIGVLLHVAAPAAIVLPLLYILVPAAAVTVGPCRDLLARRSFERLGQWSYSIYMLHILVMNLGLTSAQILLGLRSWQEVAAHPIAPILPPLLITAVVALSAATYSYIEAPARARWYASGSRERPGRLVDASSLAEFPE